MESSHCTGGLSVHPARAPLPAAMPAGENADSPSIDRMTWMVLARAFFSRQTWHAPECLLFASSFEPDGITPAQLVRLMQAALPRDAGRHLVCVVWRSVAMFEVTTVFNDAGPASLTRQTFLVTKGRARPATRCVQPLFTGARTCLNPAAGLPASSQGPRSQHGESAD